MSKHFIRQCYAGSILLSLILLLIGGCVSGCAWLSRVAMKPRLPFEDNRGIIADYLSSCDCTRLAAELRNEKLFSETSHSRDTFVMELKRLRTDLGERLISRCPCTPYDLTVASADDIFYGLTFSARHADHSTDDLRRDEIVRWKGEIIDAAQSKDQYAIDQHISMIAELSRAGFLTSAEIAYLEDPLAGCPSE